MPGQLEGRRILLTGASRGVGLAAAELLLDEGAEVLGVARDPARLAQVRADLAERFDGRFYSLAVDLGAKEAGEAVRAKLESTWPAVDVVIHNAGVMLHREGGIMDEPEEVVERSLAVNLMAPLRVTQALLPLLERGERPQLFNVGSGAGALAGMAEPGISSYRLSKWAVHGLTMLMARDLAGKVSVHAFDPGWVQTDLGGPDAPGTAEQAARGLLETLLAAPDQPCAFYKDGELIAW